MSQTKNVQIFSQQIKRIQRITDKHTQTELADFFGIRQSSVSDAKRRSAIPSSWLLKLMLSRNVNPEWVLTGNGPCFMGGVPAAYGGLCARRAKEEDADALRRRQAQLPPQTAAAEDLSASAAPAFSPEPHRAAAA